ALCVEISRNRCGPVSALHADRHSLARSAAGAARESLFAGRHRGTDGRDTVLCMGAQGHYIYMYRAPGRVLVLPHVQSEGLVAKNRPKVRQCCDLALAQLPL